MIKGKKNLFIALGLIILLAIGTFIALGINNNEKNEQPASSGDAYVVVSETAEEIASVKVESEDVNLEAVNNGISEWTIDGYEKGEISSAKAYELAGTVSNLTSKNKYDNSGDLKKYGLDKPAVTVTLNKKNGDVIKLYIGDKSPAAEEYFLIKDGDESIYTLYSYKLETLLRPAAYYTDFNRLELDATEITGVKVERGEETVELRVSDKIDRYSTVVWEMLSPFESPANDDYVDNKIIAPLSEIELASPVDDADGGFEEKNTRLIVTVTPYDDATGEYGSEKTEILEIGASSGSDTYIRYDGKIYTVPTESISFINDSAFNIVSKMQTLVNIAKVKSVSVEYNGKSHTIEISRNSDNTYSFVLDGKQTDKDGAHAIYESIISIPADDVYSGDDVGETVLKISYDAIDEADNTVIEIKRIDDLYCAIERNGKADFTVKSSKVTEFIETFDKYIDDNNK